MRLQDKVILVTASTRGIGLAIVKKCAQEGAMVYMAARDMERAQEIANTLHGVKYVYNDATKPEEFRNLFLRHIPLGRIGLPEEIAEAVVYFASDTSAYTTGQILTISGGFGLATPVYGDLANKANRR